MKLDEAIETLETMKRICRNLFPPKEQSALKLGIEAMKYRLELEREDPEITLEPLPGETKE